MINDFSNYLVLGKTLYRNCTENVCAKFDLTSIELAIIMYLNQNPSSNRATDITENCGFAKSNVSTAIRNLQKRGLVECYLKDDNRRNIHLQILDSCLPILKDAELARQEFLRIALDGFSESELERMKINFHRLTNNIKAAVKAQNRN